MTTGLWANSAFCASSGIDLCAIAASSSSLELNSSYCQVANEISTLG